MNFLSVGIVAVNLVGHLAPVGNRQGAHSAGKATKEIIIQNGIMITERPQWSKIVFVKNAA